jgi:hypothetical protein
MPRGGVVILFAELHADRSQGLEDMAMKRGLECFGHVHDDKVPQEDHHVWPKEFGGPSVPSNMARGCCNAHSDTNYFLNLLLKYKGLVPWDIEQEFGSKIRRVAQRGYVEIVAHAPHLLPALRKIADLRLTEGSVDPLLLRSAWRDFSVAHRGCPFGSHGPGEPHHYTCHVSDD